MTFEEWYRKLTEEVVDMEKLLLGIMFVSSTYMFWESFNFSNISAARFPRLTAGVVLVGSLLLLIRGYLPDRIEAIITEPAEIFQPDEEVAEVERESTAEAETEPREESAAETEENRPSIVDRPIHDSMFTALATIGYGLLGFAIGIFLATPIFVAAYTLWFRFSWPRVLGLTLFGWVIAYAFVLLLGIPIDHGEIFFTSAGALDYVPLFVGGIA